VGAAALGFARRALDEALSFATGRRLGSGTLADNAVTQAKLADMALAIDAAVQMHGGAGVTKGVKVEELYRDIRALRIYEGASEVQRQIIARDLLKGAAT